MTQTTIQLVEMAQVVAGSVDTTGLVDVLRVGAEWMRTALLVGGGAVVGRCVFVIRQQVKEDDA